MVVCGIGLWKGGYSESALVEGKSGQIILRIYVKTLDLYINLWYNVDVDKKRLLPFIRLRGDNHICCIVKI